MHLSYGTVDAAEYCQEMISDLLVHAWDLARGIGADERLHPELVRLVYDQYAPRADELHQLGLFGAPVPVPDDADPQTTLIALFGRRRSAAGVERLSTGPLSRCFHIFMG